MADVYGQFQNRDRKGAGDRELRAFQDEALTTEDFEQAAHWSNACRRRGVSGSGVDFLICGVAVARGWKVFTTDSDFRAYAKVVPIRLH